MLGNRSMARIMPRTYKPKKPVIITTKALNSNLEGIREDNQIRNISRIRNGTNGER
jgi:hypothetical protein